MPNGVKNQTAIVREKYIALWSGVVFFTALITVVWVSTVKDYIVAVVPPAVQEDTATMDTFLRDFQSGLIETKTSVEKAREALQGSASTSSASGTVLGEQASDEREVAAYRQQRIAVEKVLYGMYVRLQDGQSSGVDVE